MLLLRMNDQSKFSPSNFFQHSKLLETPAEVVDLVEKLRQSKWTLHGKPAFSIDTEFIREKTFYPIMALIQVGTDCESWLIDPMALNKAALQPFLDLLADRSFYKIIHAAQADQECFITRYETLATPSFDTAVAGSLCGFGEAPGLAKLVKEICGVSLEKSHARTDWTARPLPDKLFQYAHQDVRYLELLTDALVKKLEGLGRLELAFSKSAKYEDPAIFNPTAEEIADKITKNRKTDGRTFVALVELVKWREKRVKDLDLPRRWVADDDLLLAVAASRPRDLSHLSAFRGLNKGELRHSGEMILKAIEKANAIPDKELPRTKKPDSPDDHEIRAIEALAFFMRLMSDKHEISSKMLGSSEILFKLIRANPRTKEDLEKILPDVVVVLVGAELLDFLHGKLAIALDGTDVRVVART